MAEILNRQRKVAVRSGELEVFARRVRRALRLSGEGFAVCLVSDAEMARMNQRFRGKRGTTDVLSFPVNANGDGRRAARSKAAGFLGDIAISPETARRNAKRYGRTLADELRVLVLHGALHLMGYDHETDDGQMERREARLRRQLGIA
jgi:probable rRNA maturation factor